MVRTCAGGRVLVRGGQRRRLPAREPGWGLEVADAAEEQPLKSPAEVAVRWLHPEPAGARPGALLEEAVRAEWPGGRVAAVGYWKLGAALE